MQQTSTSPAAAPHTRNSRRPGTSPPRRTAPFEVRAGTTGGEAVLWGELDAYTAPQLRTALDEMVQERGSETVVLDLSGLTFIDLSGVGALVAAQNQARQVGGELVLRALPDQTWKILEITGLNQSFTIED